MQDLSQESIFRVGDTEYIVKRAPTRFWPCQNCAFIESCLELKDAGALPPCKKEQRSDRTAVVFYEYIPEHRPRGRK